MSRSGQFSAKKAIEGDGEVGLTQPRCFQQLTTTEVAYNDFYVMQCNILA